MCNIWYNVFFSRAYITGTQTCNREEKYVKRILNDAARVLRTAFMVNQLELTLYHNILSNVQSAICYMYMLLIECRNIVDAITPVNNVEQL